MPRAPGNAIPYGVGDPGVGGSQWGSPGSHSSNPAAASLPVYPPLFLLLDTQLIALEVKAYSMALLDFAVQHASRPMEEWLLLVPHFMHEAVKAMLVEQQKPTLV